MTTTDTKNSTWRSLPTSHKIAWIIGLTVVVLLVISELSGDDPSAPADPTIDRAPAVEEPADPAPLIDDEFEPDPEMLAELAIDLTWEQQSSSAQADACTAWGIDKEWATDLFMEGVHEGGGMDVPDGVVRHALTEHMDEMCP